jgi:formate dehydrogenase subunit gamma
MQLGGIFGVRILAETVWAVHVTIGLALVVTLAVFVYYLIVTKDYKWYGLRRIPYSLKYLIAETKAWFGVGPHVFEPIRFNLRNPGYDEKVIPTVVVVWWVYVILGLMLSVTGLAMVFPEQLAFIYQLANTIGHPITGVGGYAFIRAIHRLAMFLLVGVVVMHMYSAWVFKLLRSIVFGDREEPVIE